MICRAAAPSAPGLILDKLKRSGVGVFMAVRNEKGVGRVLDSLEAQEVRP
ncbi:MAG: hypothetical protein JRM83_05900, partial [Nitrososphaerota archaeon]|nr:hypothetical protein [Nitrososphaerota archaeon]